jgi:hypothetical protein
MRRIELCHFGQLQNKGVLRRVRRKIEGAIQMGECVLLDAEDAVVEEHQMEYLVNDLPQDKLRICGFPLYMPVRPPI